MSPLPFSTQLSSFVFGKTDGLQHGAIVSPRCAARQVAARRGVNQPKLAALTNEGPTKPIPQGKRANARLFVVRAFVGF